jgi:DNA-binding response OmpR family regulator
VGEESRAHVLVVDDDPSIRVLCRVNLELAGWTVRDAASLAEARDHLADGAVRVVLLDANLGAENGVAFLRELRAAHPATKVAMLTGLAERPRLGDVAPDTVIAKPFTLDELTEAVADLA